jgi:hypothetical protein
MGGEFFAICGDGAEMGSEIFSFFVAIFLFS